MASIRERVRADGTPSFAVLWRDPDTKRQSSLTYDEENDARVAKHLLEVTGGHTDEAARIADAVRHHGPSVVEAVAEHIDLLTAVGPDNRASYRTHLRRHIAPTLGSYPVAVISYRHVAGWIRSMSDSGLSPKTIASIHGLLSASMSTAVRLGYRTDNPCVGVQLRKSQLTQVEMTVLTRGEFALLLSHVQPLYQPLVLLLVATGLRWGEATALTPGDSIYSPNCPRSASRRRGSATVIVIGMSAHRRPSERVGRFHFRTNSSTYSCRWPRESLQTHSFLPTQWANRFRRRAFGLRLGHPRSTRRPTQGVPTARRTRTLRDLGDAHECTTCGTRTRRG
nr:hypothetical protein [Cellulomonas sp. PhB150]